MMSASSMGKVASPMAKSQERIYSAHQLSQALRSGLDAVKDQLQVLSILDGTAASWPGVNQAIDDLHFLIDMSAQTTSRLEASAQKADANAFDCKAEVSTLKDTLAFSNKRCEVLTQESAQAIKESRQLASKLDASGKEVHQQRQELWTLEKQRADLASEVEKYKQDNEFMEGELSSLRSTVTEQMQQLTALKEELAARKADVQHMKQSSSEHKVQAVELRKQLDSSSLMLRAAQSQLEQLRSDKKHFEKESERLAEEAGRLGAELNKISTEAGRQKDWGDVVKKVEADKFREEQQAHGQTRAEFAKARSELEKTIVRLTAELSNKEQQAVSKTAEASNAGKQVGLLNLQLKDVQKQLTMTQGDKAALLKDHEACKAELTRLQTKLQTSSMQAAQQDNERVMAESRAKELALMEKSKLQSAQEEARKEAAVQKAVADGWAREIKELQARLRAEQSTAAALQEQLDGFTKRNEGGNGKQMEMVKSIATMEQVIRDLQAQLTNKDTEMRKAKAEASSSLKSYEKQIEKLQRECNESAAEIQRIRSGEALRLPPLANRPQSLQDELDYLKKYVSHSFASDRGPYASGQAVARLGGNMSPSQGSSSPKRHMT